MRDRLRVTDLISSAFCLSSAVAFLSTVADVAERLLVSNCPAADSVC